jgi:mannose-1-phosphate guanylyltransferase/mannose-6-phosphate isomerase
MFPKQFLPLTNGAGESLLAETLRRLTRARGFETPVMLASIDHRFLLLDELARTGIEAREILLEPAARNTAPAIAAAALSIMEESPDAILAVMPSDHALPGDGAFAEAVRRASEIASQQKMVLFGIAPSEPHTGYGYIHKGAPLNGQANGAYQVGAFKEKPDQETARGYLADGGYLWNSGIFVLHAATFLSELEAFVPEIVEHARAALENATRDPGFTSFRRLQAASYERCPNISVDCAVMEKTAKAAVLPLDMGWSDVGSWGSLWELAERDPQDNAARGDCLLMDTERSYVHAGEGLVATLGVSDLVVVSTPDAVLVADRARAQDIGKLVAALKASNRREHQQHLRTHRPWGHFQTLNLGPRFQVKLLHVKPGAVLSLQRHYHRSEHWIVVTGTAKVTCEDEIKLVSENESFYISATQWHRLENPGKVALELIEVQIGGYLGEDDIERKEDIYQRAADETK